MRYSKKPIVAAPFGQTLGGGCEVMMHCTKQGQAKEHEARQRKEVVTL